MAIGLVTLAGCGGGGGGTAPSGGAQMPTTTTPPTTAPGGDVSTPRSLPEGTLDIITRSGHRRLKALPAQGDTAIYDAGLAVPELETALGRIQSARAAATALRWTDLQMHKHLGAPAQ